MFAGTPDGLVSLLISFGKPTSGSITLIQEQDEIKVIRNQRIQKFCR
jgi:hypothetical protein